MNSDEVMAYAGLLGLIILTGALFPSRERPGPSREPGVLLFHCQALGIWGGKVRNIFLNILLKHIKKCQY